MSMESLAEIFPDASFQAVNEELCVPAKEHLEHLAKPAGSLGELEKVAMRLYVINRGRIPIRVDPAILYTVAADHGVASQNISPYPQSVTRQMVQNFLEGGAASSVLCRASRINHKIVDAGCAGESFNHHPFLIDRRLGSGTKDMTSGPAMSEEICKTGLRAGFGLAQEAAQEGYGLIATGEMGIGNSTSASTLYCGLLGLKPEEAAGPGAGASPAMIAHKAAMIEKALTANAAAVESHNPLRILAALGGFEIVVLAGIMLGSASQRLPFVVDGFICAAAYAAAWTFFPAISGYAFFSHFSAEPAFRKILELLKPASKPLLDLEMRLGEGTGAALAVSLLRSAAAIFNEMATFDAAGVDGKSEN